ncbi:DNA helicase RecQ [Thermoactinomyces intermedius]|uniref:DNA helicase RecQ n=1 Tax=Thermoactinomyces intermedius TaxID=2024 RepID=A0A8I1ADR0_THEIN|nr:DNA helicase RecQ [Thermoactinomyces intermedius]MBA4549677.1 DNA helicase RecQ [Thermoactinomyces intermedius]MBA4835081.1 DNA helicase RecQ [Thermoactinomyces intermedius]MBH8595912.1 DNA helicase RecQ [Thermoactinomyces intermedius]
MSMEQAELLLQKYFGYSSFRSGQKKIIESILSGHHTMGIMPTGGGKSICYQIPALMFPGITLVISPLISLMKDQVDRLRQHNISATYINSSLSSAEISRRLKKLKEGAYKLLYIAPERLESLAFQEIFATLPVYLVTIDEAHCISQWGHDFRPSYRSMAKQLLSLPRRPLIAALTATATPDVKEDISRLLQIDPSRIYSTRLERPNLSFQVIHEENRLDYIKQYLREHPRQNGIIYCATRKDTDHVYEALVQSGFSAAKYHAGLTDEEREKAQEQFSYDRVQTIVATNAFGMGIDKSNVRFVIHYQLPRNLECYYQEAGRAGRDGEKSECILLYSPQDVPMQRYLIRHSDLSPERKTLEFSKLQKLVNYCHTQRCFQEEIVRYFGADTMQPCGTCGNCRKKMGDLVNYTIEAQKIFSCIKRLNEQYGLTIIAKVLRGSKNKRLKEWKLDRISTYGTMREYTEKEIQRLCQLLASDGYLSLIYEGRPYPLVRLTPKAIAVLKGKEPVYLHKETEKWLKTKTPETKTNRLLDELVSLRKQLSETEKLPPYMIFPDSTLKEMCRRLPVTEEEMQAISGVGEMKFQKYGAHFLQIIQEYVQKHGEKPAREKTTGKPSSHFITYQMFLQGKSIPEIAKERNLTRGTIEDHLLRAGLEGLELDWDAFIPKEYEALIMEKVEELGAQKLRPIKEALPEAVDYMAIKAVIAKRERLQALKK